MNYFIFFICVFSISLTSFANDKTNEKIIIDSEMTFEEAIAGTKAPNEIIDSLVLVNVKYYSFDGKLHQGQIVVHKSVESDIIQVFDVIYKTKFPVGKAIPIVKYKWSDDSSMSDNNSSSFCYRFIAGTERLSLHAYGKAMDINPFYNPVIYEDGKISPNGAKYNPEKQGTFTSDSPVVQEFIKLGWRWGGNFNSFKDYHHFDKK